MKKSALQKRGAVLLIVLWALILLAIVLTNFAFMVRTNLHVISNYANESVLRAIAEGGIERAIAELQNDTGPSDTLYETWADSESDYLEAELGEGTFTLLGLVSAGDSVEVRPGLEDEAAKLNLQTADRQALQRLGGLTDEQIETLIDWRDEDSTSSPLGAEIDYYARLEPPYPCKNANFTTIRELLLVKGFDASTLYGEDWNQNGQLDPNENDGDESLPHDDGDGVLDPGILPFVTIYSEDPNINAAGEQRVDLNQANEETLKSNIPGLTDKEAKAIVAHRENNEFQNVGQLLRVREVIEQENQQQTQNDKSGEQKDRAAQGREQSGKGHSQGNPQQSSDHQGQEQQRQGQQTQQQQGPLIIDRSRLKQIIDYCKVGGDESAVGRINVNTAPARVLKTLPGLSPELADAIVLHRQSPGQTFETIAHLLDVHGFPEDTFIGLSDRVTVRSTQFTARSVARIEGVPRPKTIIAVIDRSDDKTRILYWNEP